MSADDLLREAARRWMIRGGLDHIGGTTLTTAWLGLGTKTDYAPAVKRGWMVPIHGESHPRCATWWRLTDAGAAAMVTLLLREREAVPHA